MPISGVEIRGLVEAQQKIAQVVRDLRGEAYLRGMREATLMVTRSAKLRAPVDTGRLRASITPTVQRSGETVTGVVGTNVKYAAAVELGSRPHYPPIAPLKVWARRKGLNAYAVANAIAKRGTEPRRFLQQAFDENKNAIAAKLSDV
ncbi:MAG: HK97 gp10 family phage protein, partial [Anaerolineae bacterium]|nr:HK97 gp10 family phage protein [Anaerolineae bacterium]